MTKTQTLADKKSALLARLSDQQIIDARPATTAEERLAGAWLADELERRHPAIADILDRIFADDTAQASYGEALAIAYLEVTA